MSTKKDEVKTTTGTANPTGSTVDYKNYSSTGWGGTADLAKYGIDYSQEQRDAIANIFRDQATAAYQTAQNDFSNTMATQQASLADTIRRSQSQAVATGASRGMQAANELSSMLGLQQTAAQEASKMQGTYAEALANAQKNAYDVQNAANQVGAQMYAADSASEAQKYVANMEDPYRVLQVMSDLRASGQGAAADMLLQSFLASSGVSEGAIANTMTSVNRPEITEDGSHFKSLSSGTVSGLRQIREAEGDREGSNFTYGLDGKNYKMELGFRQKSLESKAENIPDNTAFVYNNKICIKNAGQVWTIGGQGKAGVGEDGDYGKLKKELEAKGYVLK